MVVVVPATVLLSPPRTMPAAIQSDRPIPQQTTNLQHKSETLTEENIYNHAPESFFILNESTGEVEELKASDYVRGAVAAEMPARFHPEALKAQAVAAYSYAVYHAQQQRSDPDPDLMGADFAADPENLKGYLTEAKAREFYGGDFDYYWDKVCSAADQGGKYLLLQEGRPIAAAYHAVSAGKTESAANVWKEEELPYLQAVESEGDLLAAGYETCVSFTAQQLRQRLSEGLEGVELPQEPSRWVVPLEHSPSGYVTLVQVGNRNITGLELRFLLGLRSSCFEVKENNGSFIFTVRGYGHGVGLSQNGADYMARQGASFDEILLHYYPGTTLALSAS